VSTGSCDIKGAADLLRRELHERLLLRNEQTKQVHLPEVYVQHESSKKNIQTWMNAQFLQDAVPHILYVCLSS
jgi:hypothetical protein